MHLYLQVTGYRNVYGRRYVKFLRHGITSDSLDKPVFVQQYPPGLSIVPSEV